MQQRKHQSAISNSQSTPNLSMFRPIVPAPPSSSGFNLRIAPQQLATASIMPISPTSSPLANPMTPQIPGSGGMMLPPFETPPVSPFSNPSQHEYGAGQSVFKLPPPLQSLNHVIHSQQQQQQLRLPPSPTHTQATLANSNSTNISSTRYERILPKQPIGPSAAIFSFPLVGDPPVAVSSSSNSNRPIMQHHISIIHAGLPHQPPSCGSSSAAATAAVEKSRSTADERELARKVSHSAIERRRRERINDKIMQLKDLIPSCADQDHLHKLNILQSAIDYIEYLQGKVAEMRDRRERSNSQDSQNDDDCNMGERKTVKKSKFDRYEIPSRSNASSHSLQGRETNDEDYPRKRGSVSSSSSMMSTQHVGDAESDEQRGSDTTINEESNNSEPIESRQLSILSSSNTTTLRADKFSSTSLIANQLKNNELNLSLSSSPFKFAATSKNNEHLISSAQINMKTRDIETQTAQDCQMTDIVMSEEEQQNWQECNNSLNDMEEHLEETPTRRMTVQQLLC
ncbi:hypothetical protein G9A89_009861 [Geosiphon pyriformis]|nr:hypothetical protein G9A89_009861 [Geosiphon pyriformis]